MSETTVDRGATLYKIGFGLLVLIIAGNAIGHLVIHFYDKELVTLLWTEVNLLGAIILFIPYRRFEKWAWYTIWILAACFAIITFYLPDFSIIFFILALIIAAAQFLTYRSFVTK